MRLITRYLLSSFLGPLFVCLIAFNAIFIIFDLFGHLSRFLESGAGFWLAARYYGGIVSMYSHWFVPASCLLATLYTMWRLSHHSELTAMRASGISFQRLTFPFFAVSVCLSLLIIVNSEWIAPELSTWSERFKEAEFQLDAVNREQELQYLEFPEPLIEGVSQSWAIDSADVSSESGLAKLTSPVKVTRIEDSHNMWRIRASEAEYLDGEWWLTRPAQIHFGTQGEEAEPVLALVSRRRMPLLTVTPRDMLLDQREWELFPLADMLRYLQRRQVDDPGKWYAFYYRLSAPWACVVITIFAIPAGITTGRKSVIKGVIMALVAFFSFYAVTLVLQFMGHHGICPPLAAALIPNVLYLFVGLLMYRKLT